MRPVSFSYLLAKPLVPFGMKVVLQIDWLPQPIAHLGVQSRFDLCPKEVRTWKAKKKKHYTDWNTYLSIGILKLTLVWGNIIVTLQSNCRFCFEEDNMLWSLNNLKHVATDKKRGLVRGFRKKLATWVARLGFFFFPFFLESRLGF